MRDLVAYGRECGWFESFQTKYVGKFLKWTNERYQKLSNYIIHSCLLRIRVCQLVGSPISHIIAKDWYFARFPPYVGVGSLLVNAGLSPWVSGFSPCKAGIINPGLGVSPRSQRLKNRKQKYHVSSFFSLFSLFPIIVKTFMLIWRGQMLRDSRNLL